MRHIGVESRPVTERVLFTLLDVTVGLGVRLFIDIICFGISHINNTVLLRQYYAVAFKHEIYTFIWLCRIANLSFWLFHYLYDT